MKSTTKNCRFTLDLIKYHLVGLPHLALHRQVVCVLFRYAVVLAFDVRIERDAQEMADSLGVKIFSADIIYHLFDKFTAYREVNYDQSTTQFVSFLF